MVRVRRQTDNVPRRSSIGELPDHWRNRAYEARETARLMVRDETKQRLNQLAEKYEQLAQQAEAAPAEAAVANRAKSARDR
jgi:hypothetical protein